MRNESGNRKCQQCGVDFHRPPSANAKFCSFACKGIWMTENPIPLEERLWRRVDRSGGPDACWPWTGVCTQAGYGHISSGPTPNRRLITSRVAYEVTHGPLAPGEHVLHSCDNPPCCNPAHLRVGDPAANSDDKVARGRQARGVGHGNARFSDGDIAAMRALSEAGHTGRYIAKVYGASEGYVSMVLRSLARP